MFGRRYSEEPQDRSAFTRRLDRAYTQAAPLYDFAVKALPVWKTWLRGAIPHIAGPKVLEISFGTGFLLTQYAKDFDCTGVDYNLRMVRTARANLRKAGIHAPLLCSDVASLPFRPATFDCIVNTMAFSGYPDGQQAIAEMHRVLKPEARLVMVDINYPKGSRPLGALAANLWKAGGDLLRDMDELLDRAGFDYEHNEIGGFGSVHLYVARKPA